MVARIIALCALLPALALGQIMGGNHMMMRQKTVATGAEAAPSPIGNEWGWWSIDSDADRYYAGSWRTSTTMADDSGNGNNGTYTSDLTLVVSNDCYGVWGLSKSTGREGQLPIGNGIDTSTTSFSIAYWSKDMGATAGQEFGTATPTTANRWFFLHSSSGNIHWGLYNARIDSGVAVSGWHHVVLICDHTGGGAGQFQATIVVDGTTIVSQATTDFVLDGNFETGQVATLADEYRYWDYAISTDDANTVFEYDEARYTP